MNREQEIVRTGYVGIGTNVCVAMVKAAVGLAAGSVAIVLDAVNNVTDALSSIITVVGIKLAGRPADDKHPFGYGRIEYFTALMVAMLVVFAGGTSLIESVKGILEPEEQEYTSIGLSLIALMVLVKLLLGLYTKKKGKALKSDALVSSGMDSMFDSIISASTLVSALVFVLLGVSIDAWLALVISCLIIKAGMEMLLSPVRELLGLRADASLTGGIKKRVKESFPQVRGVFDVVLHNYGTDRNIGALHVEVEETMNASELHQLTRRIQKLVYEEYSIFVTVGFYAHHADGTHEAEEEKSVREYVMAQEGVLGMHGFYINDNDHVISFDIVYSFSLSSPISLREKVIEHLKERYKDYTIYIGLDRNFSE